MVNGFQKLALVASLVVSQCMAQDAVPFDDSVPNCVGIMTPGFTGDIVDQQTCAQACQVNGGVVGYFDRVDGRLTNGTDFEAWRCGCETSNITAVCTSIVVGGGDPQPPPTEPFDCFVVGVLNTGLCGFSCEVVYPFRWKDVTYTSDINSDGSVSRKCDCNLNDPEETQTFCVSTTAATASPTESPTLSMAPSVSMAPTPGLIFNFPTVTPNGPLDSTDPPSAAPLVTAAVAVVAACMTVAVGFM